LINKIHQFQKNFNLYLNKNFKKNQKVLVSLSCGLDSTVLFNLLTKSSHFKSNNIFCVFFDHQKRVEGKFEIQKFIKHYKIKKSQFFFKKIYLGNYDKSFQNLSRIARHEYIKYISRKKNIKDIFLGHHLDDVYETFFLREIQQSNILGLSTILSESIMGIKFHRPLVKFSKKKILNYALNQNIFWIEDRSNLELDYTRNKIRSFLKNKNNFKKVALKREAYIKFDVLSILHDNFFRKLNKKKYEIDYQKFNNLNNSMKVFVVQSFYYNLRHNFNKTIRHENYLNFINLLKKPNIINKERSVFGGKISSYKQKICLNLN